MRNTKGLLKADPKLPTEIQDHETHVPIEDTQVRRTGGEEPKRDEADIRTFLSNTDTYDVSGNEYDGDDQDYLK